MTIGSAIRPAALRASSNLTGALALGSRGDRQRHVRFMTQRQRCGKLGWIESAENSASQRSRCERMSVAATIAAVSEGQYDRMTRAEIEDQAGYFRAL